MEKLTTIADKSDNLIYGQIREILTSARARAYSAVNFAMVEAYWLIGKYLLYLPTEEEFKQELKIAMEK